MAIDAQWSNVVLLCPFSSDLSDAKNTALAPVGNVAISATVGTPFGAGNAAAFDGTGDYIPLLDGSQWAFGTGDFTIEVWVYPTSFSGGSDMALFGSLTGSVVPFFYLFNGTGVPTFWNGSTNVSSSVAATLNAWNYVVASRVSGVLKIGVGGVERYSGSHTANFSATTGFAVGGLSSGRHLFGYLGPVRVTKVVGRGVTTLPTAPFPRPTISGTVLDHLAAPVAKTVLVYDRSTNAYIGGANSDPTTGQYTFYPPDFGELKVERIDELCNPYWSYVAFASRLDASGFPVLAGPALTATGTVTASTAVADPFGGSQPSALFTGAGSYLRTGASAALLPGTIFTLRGWLYVSSLAAENGVFNIGTLGSDTNIVQSRITTSGLINFFCSGSSGGLFDMNSAAGVITTGSWKYFEAVRDRSNAYLFIAGALVASSAVAAATESTGNDLKLGVSRAAGGGSNIGLAGRLYGVEFINGRAEHVAAYTPPTAPFLVGPADGGSGENAIIYDRVIPGG